MQKVTVHNKTEMRLVIIDFYKTPRCWGCYGLQQIKVPALQRTTFSLEKFLRDSMGWIHMDQYIHVLAEGPEEVLNFNISDFQDNKGKELILDMLDGRIQYCFLDPIPTKWIRYGLSVCSSAVLKQTWLRFVSSWKIEKDNKGNELILDEVDGCLQF